MSLMWIQSLDEAPLYYSFFKVKNSSASKIAIWKTDTAVNKSRKDNLPITTIQLPLLPCHNPVLITTQFIFSERSALTHRKHGLLLSLGHMQKDKAGKASIDKPVLFLKSTIITNAKEKSLKSLSLSQLLEVIWDLDHNCVLSLNLFMVGGNTSK